MLEHSQTQDVVNGLSYVHNIPHELQALRQWCVAGSGGEPISPHTGRMAAVDNPDTWGSFAEAYALAARSGSRIGFVLCATDPYAIIDLDNKEKDPATPDELALFAQIMTASATTYQELSKSGRGYHIVARGILPDGAGRRRGHVEVYDRSRFMILTGNCNRVEVTNQQSVIDRLLAAMPKSSLVEIPQDSTEIRTDSEILDMALRAANGDKVQILTGAPDLWRDHYPSQSEADYALLGILWFYSGNVEQTIRIFRLSPLGQREKAHRNDYVMNALDRIRANQPQPVNVTIPLPEVPFEESVVESTNFRPAPGIIGRLAEEFFQWSSRPVLEIATAAALGAVTGLVARSYNYSGTGLNQYLFLLAPTGRGKEEIHKCINRLFKEMSQIVPGVSDILGPSEFASPQAVVKTLSKKPTCLSIVGEFGDELAAMTSPHNPQKNGVRKVLLNIYNKSGHTNVLHGSAYADQEKNISAINSPALTLVGECTVEGYYRGMDLANIDNGLIPRFLSIQYHGKRVPLRKDVKNDSDPFIIRTLATIATCAISIQQQNTVCQVQSTPDAEAVLDKFNEFCDHKINATFSGLSSELWNRAHFKCFRLAAVLAVADNPHNPVITKEHAEWAEWLVTEDLNMTMERFESGDIGSGDAKQLADLRRSIADFFTKTENELVTAYAIPSDLLQRQLIPYIYLQRRTSGLASFKNDRLGATAALKRAVEELISTGEIQEIPRSQGHMLGYTGRLFFVQRKAATA